jgi:hypothetical protein
VEAVGSAGGKSGVGFGETEDVAVAVTGGGVAD